MSTSEEYLDYPESDLQDYGDYLYDCQKDRDLDDQLAMEEEQQRLQEEDPEYEVISIDYHNCSWEQFSQDLLNPESQLIKQLSKLGVNPF